MTDVLTDPLTSPLMSPLIVALDLDSPVSCVELARKLAGLVGAFKLGPRLLIRAGESLIREVGAFAPVFVDNKYLDIPSTMEAAVKATFEAGASLATVHAWAGGVALARLAKLEARLAQERPFKILAVTILTSFEQETLPPPMRLEPLEKQVEQLAGLALESGLTGLVCSPREALRLRTLFPDCYLVTPGIRFPGDAATDQKRTFGPAEAIDLGADAIVVGRPIVEAADPIAAAHLFRAAVQP